MIPSSVLVDTSIAGVLFSVYQKDFISNSKLVVECNT
jgi:hypothetical protein